MGKRLRFELQDGGHYIVFNKKNQALGTIENKKFYPFSYDTWFMKDCLNEISEFMNSLERPFKEQLSEL